jgi:saccharopine dehydrogenase (NAD+, L-lysine-forming)
MARLLFWSLKTFPPKPVGTSLMIDAEGEITGLPIKLSLAVAHRDEYVLTAIPVVAGIRQYLSGTIRKPGLWMLGHIVEPFSFVTDLGRMGLDLSLKLR